MMIRARQLVSGPLLLLAALVQLGCGGSDDTPVGAVRVIVTTEGNLPDPDGYTVVVGERAPEPVPAAGEVTIPGLAVGAYEALLDGFAPYCHVSTPNPVAVEVEADVVALAAFVVTCDNSGSVLVRAVTTGIDIDVDGYVVSIGGGAPAPLSPNGSHVVVSGALGVQPIVLDSVASNCVPAAGNPATVEVVQGQRPGILLNFACTLTTGTIITTLTGTGDDLPVGGFTVTVGEAHRVVRLGVPDTLSLLPAGDYDVSLSPPLPSNCTPQDGSSRKVAVGAADSVTISFTVACVPLPRARVRFTAATSGVAPDANGYQVTIGSFDGFSGAHSYSVLVPSAGSAEIAGVVQGTYHVSITDVAPHCRIVNMPQNVEVATIDRDLSLAVNCLPAPRLAYVANGGANADIHLTSADGSIQALPAAGADSNPAWARNGTELAFTAHRDGNAEIYRMGHDGSGAVRLTDHPAADYRPAWSPDGTQIAFVSERDGNAEIYVMSRDGTGLQRLTTHPGRDSDPAWSPDGTRLVFASNRDTTVMQLYVASADGSNVVRLTSTGEEDRMPAWSPDGSQVAFSRRMGPSIHLYVVASDGGLPRAVDSSWGTLLTNPDWSPAGLQVVYAWRSCRPMPENPVCRSGLAIHDLAGLDTFAMPALESTVSDPAWRP